MAKKRSSTSEPLLKFGMTKAEKAKDYRLRKRYGIDLQEYQYMLHDQDYKCAICGKKNEDEKYGLVVDHNHATGHVRGLLCSYCNRRIVGRIGDDRRRMEGFIKYIKTQMKEDKLWKRKPLKK